MKIVWREDLTHLTPLNEKVGKKKRLWRVQWDSKPAGNKKGFIRLRGVHWRTGDRSVLCRFYFEGPAPLAEDMTNIARLARLRYAEFFEEDKCG